MQSLDGQYFLLCFVWLAVENSQSIPTPWKAWPAIYMLHLQRTKSNLYLVALLGFTWIYKPCAWEKLAPCRSVTLASNNLKYIHLALLGKKMTTQPQSFMLPDVMTREPQKTIRTKRFSSIDPDPVLQDHAQRRRCARRERKTKGCNHKHESFQT